MINKKPINTGFVPLLLGLLLITAGISFAQERSRTDYLQRYQNGTQLYQIERWQEAAMEFRRAQELSPNNDDWSQALYWVILSELAYSDYGSAIIDMDELQRRSPNTAYTRDMVYHRARIYFNQGYFDDALLFFKRYIDSVSHLSDSVTVDRIAAAYFWMGESLYSMGQYDEAAKFYTWVVDQYPKSPKYDACLFRLELIKQKKIEAELLALLQWSHEESLRTSENYQRTIRTYEQALDEYQRRIAEFQASGSVPGANMQTLQDNQFQTFENTSDDDDAYARLLERAKLLNAELERILNERYSGGSW